MLGSASDAEDIVQEAQLRLHRALEDGHEIQSPRAFVATVTTRLAINKFRPARAGREQYVGEWLPEPIFTDSSDDPAQHAQMVVVGGRGMCRFAGMARPRIELGTPRFSVVCSTD
jgi:DNA-directed RNA polymerase specialized sigma24 family protein